MARFSDIEVIGQGVDPAEAGEGWRSGSAAADSEAGATLVIWDDPMLVTINVDLITQMLEDVVSKPKAAVIGMADGTRWIVDKPRDQIEAYLKSTLRRV